jgi:hypothetical protein
MITTINAVLIILVVLAMPIGGILLLKRSAKKFYLSEDELERIKERNKRLDKADKADKAQK